MAIKEEKKRFTITLSQKHMDFLDLCKIHLKVKTYGCVIRKLIDFDIKEFSVAFIDLFDK